MGCEGGGTQKRYNPSTFALSQVSTWTTPLSAVFAIVRFCLQKDLNLIFFFFENLQTSWSLRCSLVLIFCDSVKSLERGYRIRTINKIV